MRAGNRSHTFRRRIIVEQNAGAAIDLKVDEAGCQQGIVRQASLRPIVRNLPPCRQPVNAAVLDQHRGIAVPAAAIENPVAEDGKRTMLHNGILVRMHPGPYPIGRLDCRPANSNLTGNPA